MMMFTRKTNESGLSGIESEKIIVDHWDNNVNLSTRLVAHGQSKGGMDISIEGVVRINVFNGGATYKIVGFEEGAASDALKLELIESWIESWIDDDKA